MQRMQREQRRHHGAAPQRARHPPQQQEQQQRVGDMKPHAHQVLRPRLVAEELESSMWESQVNGCQLLAWPVLKAQTTFSHFSPL